MKDLIFSNRLSISTSERSVSNFISGREVVTSFVGGGVLTGLTSGSEIVEDGTSKDDWSGSEGEGGEVTEGEGGGVTEEEWGDPKGGRGRSEAVGGESGEDGRRSEEEGGGVKTSWSSSGIMGLMSDSSLLS